ncbi:MAG: sigma-70 family RNA polymerase sigma factor [Ignavibacteriota bacterium]
MHYTFNGAGEFRNCGIIIKERKGRKYRILDIKSMKLTDQELLLSIAGGDGNALSEFYDRHSRLIYGSLLRMFGDTDDAEDIVQEVFIQVWRKASTYKPELGSPKNWLVRIAHNRGINLIRSKRLRGENAKVPLPDEDLGISLNSELIDDTLLSQTISAERMQMISLAMQDLPKDQSLLVELAFLQGYSHSEISEHLKLPLGTVKTKIRNGLLALRQSLGFLKGEFS